MVRRALVIAALALTGCPDEPPDRFHCHIDEQCVEGGRHGYCEISNDCSFEDTMCSSSRRFGELSSSPGQCVETTTSTSLVTNGGFEMGTTAWADESSTPEMVADAHTLDAAVRVCRNDAADATFAIRAQPDVLVNLPVGDHLVARAWVKAGPSEAGQVVAVQLRPTEVDGGEPPVGMTDPPVVPDGEWQEMTAEYEVTPEPLAKLELLVEADQEPGTEGCFLVDDVAVFRLP